jgi:signal transduction histidine kinase
MKQEKIKFTIDSGAIDRLGRELVTRSETAVSELIKNAYDADATEVSVIFRYSGEYYTEIIIEDNGEGMDKTSLKNGFMRISSSNKVHNPKSKKFNRVRAGQKGIGRFATQRLGEKLVIETQSPDENNSWRLTIDWNQYVMDRELGEVENLLEEMPRREKSGTKLMITSLRDQWSDAAIRRIYRYATEIQKPDFFNWNNKGRETLSEDSFNIKFFIQNEASSDKVLFADEATEYYDYAIAEFSGEVDSLGNGNLLVNSKGDKIPWIQNEYFKIGRTDENNKDTSKPFHQLKNVKFRLLYFYLDTPFIPNNYKTAIREFTRINGGIKLFRNGFRVPPYGSEGNDWLGLDLSGARRSIKVTLSNRHVIGFVEIVEDANSKDKLFQESASREGIIHNEAYDELVDFLNKAITKGALLIKGAVEKVKEISTIDAYVVVGKYEDKLLNNFSDFSQKLSSLAEALSKLPIDTTKEIKEIEEVQKFQKLLEEPIQEEFKEIKEVIQSERNRYLEEIEFLRVLGSIGLLVGHFTHEVKQYLPAISVDVNGILNRIKDENFVKGALARIKKNLGLFKTFTTYFDGMVSQNVKRNMQPQDIKEVVSVFLETIGPDSKRSGVQIQPTKYIGFDLITCEMHPSEWSSILFNLYTNSKKAIRKANSKGKIQIISGIVEDKVYLEFYDDGIGVPNEIREKIFDAFYTTSNASSFKDSEIDELSGSGLGLKIVNDIVTAHNGSIAVKNIELEMNAEGYKTCFRVEIPMFKKKEK